MQQHEAACEAGELAGPTDNTDQRPEWLPHTGSGQSNVLPSQWSLSLGQWVFFVRACVMTAAWSALAAKKGEYNINMYDVKDQFVVPWTRGTGNSIALLMNKVHRVVELMISHAWGGSVIETHNGLLNLVSRMGDVKVPTSASIFFCTFSMYQPEDGASGGLSIGEQLGKKPFAEIIESKPLYGMFVVHTTLFEVYSRMWTVHEVDEGSLASTPMRGLFDIFRWTSSLFAEALAIETRNSECRPEDKHFLEEQIMARGGFERLDETICRFRADMSRDLEAALKEDARHDNNCTYDGGMDIQRVQGWTKTKGFLGDGCTYECSGEDSVTWEGEGKWSDAMRSVAEELGLTPEEAYPGKSGERSGRNVTFDEGSPHPLYAALPLGSSSFPYGPRRFTSYTE